MTHVTKNSSISQRGWGRIVNMSSSTLNTVVTNYVHYIASKGGVVGFTRALASEFGAFGITVNAIFAQSDAVARHAFACAAVWPRQYG